MKHLIVSCVTALVPSIAFAQVEDASFYVVEGRGCDSYLLGTVHVPVALDEFKMDVHGALRSSRALWIERKRDPRGMVGVWDEFLEHYPPAAADAKKLSAAHVDLLIALGMPPAVANVLTEDDNTALAILQQLLGDPEFLDRTLERLAEEGHLPVSALDDRREWRKVLLNERKGMPYLLMYLQSGLEAPALTAVLVKRGLTAKQDFLAGKRRTTAHGPGDLARHARWIDLLEPELDRGGVFVGVGENHLHGVGSLRERIEALGYDVRKITGGRVGQFNFE